MKLWGPPARRPPFPPGPRERGGVCVPQQTNPALPRNEAQSPLERLRKKWDRAKTCRVISHPSLTARRRRWFTSRPADAAAQISPFPSGTCPPVRAGRHSLNPKAARRLLSLSLRPSPRPPEALRPPPFPLPSHQLLRLKNSAQPGRENLSQTRTCPCIVRSKKKPWAKFVTIFARKYELSPRQRKKRGGGYL